MNEVRRIDSGSSDFSFYDLDDYNQVSQINPESKLQKINKRGVVIYYTVSYTHLTLPTKA